MSGANSYDNRSARRMPVLLDIDLPFGVSILTTYFSNSSAVLEWNAVATLVHLLNTSAFLPCRS
jgi:hypothetical protein